MFDFVGGIFPQWIYYYKITDFSHSLLGYQNSRCKQHLCKHAHSKTSLEVESEYKVEINLYAPPTFSTIMKYLTRKIYFKTNEQTYYIIIKTDAFSNINGHVNIILTCFNSETCTLKQKINVLHNKSKGCFL